MLVELSPKENNKSFKINVKQSSELPGSLDSDQVISCLGICLKKMMQRINIYQHEYVYFNITDK
jgi:hypothetical protein